MKTVLDLKHNDAKIFFLKEKSYFSFDLPLYFTFSELLKKLSKKIDNGFYNKKGIIKGSPSQEENVNYKLIHNKDGKYGWRPFQLINPAIYVSLVHKITQKNNWDVITNRFECFKKNTVVECMSIPMLKKESDKSDKARQVLTWHENIEQKSIALSLDFDYIFHTDITDCYGAIYTHSIAWAIHTKKEAKEQRYNFSLIGNIIDHHLQAMSNGQTNGIPQGSVLMDFIAEIILGYIDKELTNKIKDIKKEEYKILRYRDDYRIFVNNTQFGQEILKHLTLVLSEVGMKLSIEKTKESKNVIYDSIKQDKLYSIKNYRFSKNIQNELLGIKVFADKYPNSGSLIKVLQKLINRISKWKKTYQNVEVLISILVDIAYKNPRTYPFISAIISKFLSFLENEKKKEIFEKITTKFKKLPNTEHLDLWLQRVSIKFDGEIDYESKLCKKVSNEKIEIEIWNNNWVKDENLETILKDTKIINKDKLNKLDEVIQSTEVELFESKFNYEY